MGGYITRKKSTGERKIGKFAEEKQPERSQKKSLAPCGQSSREAVSGRSERPFIAGKEKEKGRINKARS